MPSARAASSPCPLPPTSDFSPTVLPRAELVAQLFPLLVLSLGLPFSVGSPTKLQGLSTAEYMVTTHHVTGIAQSFHLMAMGDRGVLHFSEVKTEKS